MLETTEHELEVLMKDQSYACNIAKVLPYDALDNRAPVLGPNQGPIPQSQQSRGSLLRSSGQWARVGGPNQGPKPARNAAEVLHFDTQDNQARVGGLRVGGPNQGPKPHLDARDN